MQPVFESVLENTLATHLLADPAAARATMAQDVLAPQIPHWLYVGDTPLHLAAALLRVDAAQQLLDAGASPLAVNRRGAGPLHYACDARPAVGVWNPEAQARMIGLLAAHGAPVDGRDRGGVAPLHRAVRARSPAAVRALLEAGADPLCANGAGSTPLHLAVQSTGAAGTAGAGDQQLEIARMLIAAGASLSDCDSKGVSVARALRSPALAEALAS
jgi:ankyrin repeat protein